MELLAPAGDWESFIAAVENGADAVYLGGKQFSARQYAPNFDLNQISRAVEYAHVREKKVYITVNTLLDCRELGPALDYVYELQQAGVDALIIQDAGLLTVLRRVFPDLRLHASTQMTVHNSEGVKFLGAKGVKRVVLARELSREDIKAIRERVKGIELEIFVHGALCYCYSGQCLFSSVVGGRSGNRGRCAQPCRLAYRLESAKAGRCATRGDYLLSPADLCLVEHLPEIKDIGIDSLKIEGRMKRAEYVATVVRIYREALELLNTGDYRDLSLAKKELAGIFNRNFTTGRWEGPGYPVLSTTRPNNRGVYIGRVVNQYQDRRTRIRLGDGLHRGDGIEVWTKYGKNPAVVVREMELDGNLVEAAQAGSEVVISLPGKVGPGDRVFKTRDSQLIEKAELTSVENRAEGRIPVAAEVEADIGRPLWVVLKDRQGNRGIALTSSVAQPAVTRVLTEKDVYEKINRLGNTPFYLQEFESRIAKDLMVPYSEINEARRCAVRDLIEKRLERARPPRISQEEYREKLAAFNRISPHRSCAAEKPVTPVLSVFVSRVDNAARAFKVGADRVYLGLEGLGNREKPGISHIKKLRETATAWGGHLVLALPRIVKPGEEIPWEEIEQVAPDGILAGNPGSFQEARARGFRVFCDYSLNVFNPWAARFWLDEGADGICLSPELALGQLQNWPCPERRAAEVLVHGEIILMVSEYCMLREALQKEPGRTCHAVCRRGDFSLRDRKGYVFPVETDAYCRAYLFNSRTLCMVEDLPRLYEMGFGSFRIEARRGGAEYVEKTVGLYRQALDAISNRTGIDTDRFYEELHRVAPSEFTKIHYYRGVL